MGQPDPENPLSADSPGGTLIIERLDNLRLVRVGDAPKDFAGFVEGELKRFAEMVKLAGVVPE